MKKFTFLGLLLCLVFPVFAQLNCTLQSTTTYTPILNDVWGYSAGGNEYALVGTRSGVNIVDITNPASPVDKGTATGPNSTWRDIKTYGSYAYVINDNSGGLLIIDLSGLPTPITSSDWSYWEPNIPALGGTLSRCHNIYIDGNGYGYLAGCNRNNGGIIYIDLFTTPGTPIYVDKAPPIYAHDVYVENNKMYTSDILNGEFSIYDVSNKAATIFEGSQITPDNYTHNTWTDGSSTIFTTDEVSNGSTAAYDISDPNNIIYLDAFKPLATINTGVIPHNVHVLNSYLIISHYSDGVIIVDASVPENLIEVGNYDTCSGNCSGAWGAYPFLPSGNILVSDMNEGLFVLSPTYVRAARLHGKVTDSSTSANLSGVKVTLSAAQANEENTNFTGDYKTGVATAGTYNATFEKTGYNTKTISVSISNGVTTTLDVQLVPTSVPVELFRFEVRLSSENEVALEWTAASDEAYVDFQIERSTNGTHFEPIGKVEESAPSLVPRQYNFTDVDVPFGKLYYRLHMEYASGEAKFSSIKNIDHFAADADIRVYPNPVRPGSPLIFAAEDLKAANLRVEIYDGTGVLVDSQPLDSGAHQWSYSTSELSQGVYFFKFIDQDRVLQMERVSILQ